MIPFVAAAALAACCATPAGTPPNPISHVVIVIQENRSFDNLFQGFPGADTVSRGRTSTGETVSLRPETLAARFDIDHGLAAFLESYDNGKMDGFDREQISGPPQGRHPQYAYVPHRETKLYFDIAKQYVLADRMFSSQLDGSFVAHQYLIAAQAQSAVDLPTSVWGCPGGRIDKVYTLTQQRTYGPREVACFGSVTLADELSAAGLTWRAYAPTPTDDWNGFMAIRPIYFGSAWQNVVAPSTQFLHDVAHGSLANVTWITPDCSLSDHSVCTTLNGPHWVASVVNAVGESLFWDSTAIFVVWDDWGGWYDHVKPPYEDYDGLGFRVPLLVVSPYAKRGFVSHERFEHASILRYAEDLFGLGRLAAADARANSPRDCFDMTQPPRPFVPFPAFVPRLAAHPQPADLQ